MAGMQSEEGLLAMACAAYIAGTRLHISCGRGAGSAYNGASLGLFSHLLPKTTWSELMFPRGIQRDRRPWQKEARVFLESYCLRARQRVVCDHIKEIKGENPQKWGISPEPRKFLFESERCSMLAEG